MVGEKVEKLLVGSRIDVGGNRGTVKYIGDVIDTKGTWLGIDWDDLNRGKHNGTYSGVSYFKTRFSTSGSFIRPAKACTGVSVVDAIRSRYGLIEDHAGVDVHSIAQVQKDIGAKLFQVVGAEKVNKKQSNFENLIIVSLRGQLIDCAGEPLALQRLCPNIRELDLSQTLIHSWREVAQIAKQLPNLVFLNLSENRYEIEEDVPAEPFHSVEHLVLGRSELIWQDVRQICKSVNNLSVLQVPFNCIRSLDPSDDVLMRLRWLDLEGNALFSWSEINKLGNLPLLETLNVCCCSLSEISLPSSLLFKKLRSLLLSDNRIRDWSSVSELDKLASLEELRFLKNPLLDTENTETNHQLIIARILKLKVLNGIEIIADERRGAEFDFLKRHGKEWYSAKTDEQKAEFNTFYPTYNILVKKYGPPEESELLKQSSCLKSNLIELELFTTQGLGRRLKKKVPNNMSVGKLVGLVQRLFNIGTSTPSLSVIMVDGPEVEMDNEMKNLNYYSVEDGCKIAVRW